MTICDEDNVAIYNGDNMENLGRTIWQFVMDRIWQFVMNRIWQFVNGEIMEICECVHCRDLKLINSIDSAVYVFDYADYSLFIVLFRYFLLLLLVCIDCDYVLFHIILTHYP